MALIEGLWADLATLQAALISIVLQIRQIQRHRWEFAIGVAALTAIVLSRRSLSCDLIGGGGHVAFRTVQVNMGRLWRTNIANAVNSTILVRKRVHIAHLTLLSAEATTWLRARLLVFELS